jgi:hypothetical protein
MGRGGEGAREQERKKRGVVRRNGSLPEHF